MSDETPTPDPGIPDALRARRRSVLRAPSGTAATLHEGERIIHTAQISTAIYWKAIVILGLSIVLLLFPLVFNLALFFLFVSVIAFIVAWLTQHYLLLMLTDRRVIFRYGVLALETVQLHYEKIESVELAWTPMGRLLGYATVLITGTGSRVSGIPYVANAIGLRADFDTMISAREDKTIKVQIENPAPPAA